jgi:DNA-directed RNA polymerase subunit RPC12/RpoP
MATDSPTSGPIPANKIKVFLSHNSLDKDYAARLAGALTLAGANVWFDAWSIRPGDSIPSAINEGLSTFATFALLWSSNAARSGWVANETSAAMMRTIEDKSCRMVPVLLDDEQVPPLLSHVRAVDARNSRTPIDVAREMLGIDSERALLKAVQGAIIDAGLDFKEFYGAGVYVGCPQCGAALGSLKGSHYIDDQNDRKYAGVRCKECGYEEGGEV